jgi:serine/threonine protein kinase
MADLTRSGGRAAVKVMPARRVDSEDARARFLREARLLASVEHPNVVRVYAFGEAQGQPYLVMEYVEGRAWLPPSCLFLRLAGESRGSLTRRRAPQLRG